MALTIRVRILAAALALVLLLAWAGRWRIYAAWLVATDDATGIDSQGRVFAACNVRCEELRPPHLSERLRWAWNIMRGRRWDGERL